MSRRVKGRAPGLRLLLVAMLLCGAPGARSYSRPAAAPAAHLKHMVFVLLENHSFDNVFGRFTGVDGAMSARVYGQGTIPLLHAPTVLWHDINHERWDAIKAIAR